MPDCVGGTGIPPIWGFPGGRGGGAHRPRRRTMSALGYNLISARAPCIDPHRYPGAATTAVDLARKGHPVLAHPDN
jgi:hypothetical protein